MKKHTKIRYLLVIFIIAIMTGFTCTFTTAYKENPRKATKLSFDAIEWEDPDFLPPPPTISFVEDGVLHYKDFWSYHLLEGTVGDDEITGSTQSLFHAKIDLATFNFVVNGQTWFNFTWGELTGYFTGTVNAKIVSGVLSGKFTLHGFEDFEGMKLFGTVWNIPQPDPDDPPTNGLRGIILIPN